MNFNSVIPHKIPVASIALALSDLVCKVDTTAGKVARIAAIESCLQDHHCLRSLISRPP